MKELNYLNKYFLKYKYRFLLGIFITIIAQIFYIFTPEYIGKSINLIKKYAASDKNLAYNELLHNIGIVIITAIIAGFLTFLMRQTLIVMSRHIEFDLKNEIFIQYQNLSQNFYKKNRTGDLMNRISEDVSKVRMYTGPAVMYSINTLIRFTVVVVYMYHISPKLTIYSLLPLPVLSYSIFKITSIIQKRSGQFQQNLSELTTFTQEFFSGIRVIKAYELIGYKKGAYSKYTANSKEKSIALSEINSLFGPLMILLIGMSNLIVIYLGGKMYIDGTIKEIGTIAQFILYINMLTWPVASLGWVSTMIQEAEASQKRINEFLNEQPEIKNYTDTIHPIKGDISFKNVSFTYEDTNIKALKNVSFDIYAGQTLAILGNTGSGKSTIFDLLTRLYECEDGEITIDNKSVQSYNLTHLRKSISIVPQDAFLFSDTIKNNIRFGNETSNDEEIYQVANIAAVHQNIIQFKEGYETLLGERGITLSGGQKQRVSIARALLKQSPILLLDDCLSAVDTETEEEILQNLEQITAQKTTIIITHRVSSAKNADKIIVFEDGEIIEQGTHNQLLNHNGYYKNLYQKQLLEKDF